MAKPEPMSWRNPIVTEAVLQTALESTKQDLQRMLDHVTRIQDPAYRPAYAGEEPWLEVNRRTYDSSVHISTKALTEYRLIDLHQMLSQVAGQIAAIEYTITMMREFGGLK